MVEPYSSTISPADMFMYVRHYAFVGILIIMLTAIPECIYNLLEAYRYKRAYLAEYGPDIHQDQETVHEVRIIVYRNIWRSWSHLTLISLLVLISTMVVTARIQADLGVPSYVVGFATLTLVLVFSAVLRWGIHTLRRDLQQFQRIRASRIRRELEEGA